MAMRTVNNQRYSSRNESTKTLAPKILLEKLQDFANTGDEPGQIGYFLNRRPDFLDSDSLQLGLDPSNSPKSDLHERFRKLRDMVREAWRGNEKMLGRLLSPNSQPDAEFPSYDCFFITIPDWRRSSFRYGPETEFEAAVYELLKQSRKARVCANPDCISPYFITEDPRRKFCSTACTRPAQREYKRNWWDQRGKQQRKQRAKQSAKRRPRQ